GGIGGRTWSWLGERPLVLHGHGVLARPRDETGETASLYVREGASRVCLDRVESRHGLRGTVDFGARLPPHRGAAGKVLLAYLAQDEREAILTQIEAATGEGLSGPCPPAAQIQGQG